MAGLHGPRREYIALNRDLLHWLSCRQRKLTACSFNNLCQLAYPTGPGLGAGGEPPLLFTERAGNVKTGLHMHMQLALQLSQLSALQAKHLQYVCGAGLRYRRRVGL